MELQINMMKSANGMTAIVLERPTSSTHGL